MQAGESTCCLGESERQTVLLCKMILEMTVFVDRREQSVGSCAIICPSASLLFLVPPAPHVLHFTFAAPLGKWFLCPCAHPFFCFSLLTTHFHQLFVIPWVPLLSCCVSTAVDSDVCLIGAQITCLTLISLSSPRKDICFYNAVAVVG